MFSRSKREGRSKSTGFKIPFKTPKSQNTRSPNTGSPGRHSGPEPPPPNSSRQANEIEAGGDPSARDLAQSQTPAVSITDRTEPNRPSFSGSKRERETGVEPKQTENNPVEPEGQPINTQNKLKRTENALPLELSPPGVNLMNSPELVAARLWNEAYDSLKSQGSDELGQYETIVIFWLQANSPKLAVRQPSPDRPFNDGTPIDNPQWRQAISEVVTSYLEVNHDDGEIKLTPQVRAIMQSTYHSMAGSVLPWLGICLSLKCLEDHSFRSEDVISGISHVLSRMPWYNILPKLLDGDDKASNLIEGYSSAHKLLLRERIRELYKEILSHQIRVVCSQRNGFSQTSLITIDLSKAGIVTAERALECFNGEAIEDQIRQVANSRNEQRDGDATTVPDERDNRSQISATDNEEDAITSPEDNIDGQDNVKALLKSLSAIDCQENDKIPSGDREEILKLLYQWISSFSEYKSFHAKERRILWINGALGSGKSMWMSAIMWGLSQQAKSSWLPIILSFGRGRTKPENATSAIKSLLYAILNKQSSLINHLADKFESIGRKRFSYPNDFYSLSLVLISMVQDERFKATLILVDGVDEIRGGDTEFHRILKLMNTTMSASSKIKWLVSSDALPPADAMDIGPSIGLDKDYPKGLEIFNNYYIPSKIEELTSHGSYDEASRQEIIELLQKSSSGNFFRADVACEVIKRADPWHAPEILKELQTALASNADLFSHMLDKISKLRLGDSNYCFKILGTLAETYRPLKLAELNVLMSLPPQVDISILIRKHCFAFLDHGESICFTHHSARDFYRQNSKEESVIYHQRIVKNCLYSLTKLFEVSPDEQRSRNMVTPTNYATLYWIRHLYHVIDDKETRNKAIEFLTKELLKWSEVLVSLGWLSQACFLMLELETRLRKKLEERHDDAHIQAFLNTVYETQKFLSLHEFLESPTGFEVKNTLLFSPLNSTTRQKLLHSELPELVNAPIMDDNWNTVLHVLRGHSDYVRCCACSSDGQYLASGSDDGSVRIWDTKTGKVQHKFQAFNNYVHLVAFSSRGLVAASDLSGIKIWDTNSGSRQKSENNRDLDGGYLGGRVNDINFSNDGSMLAAAIDSEIKIWDTSSHSVIAQVTSSDRLPFNCVRFSKDDLLLGSTWRNHVTIWNLSKEPEQDKENPAADGELAAPRKFKLREWKDFLMPRNSNEWAYQIAFSPDSKHIATGTDGEYLVYIWDLQSEKPVITLSGFESDITAIAFSPDGSCLASASGDKTVRIWETPWDRERKQSPWLLDGHSGTVYDVSFSPSDKYLVSCSSDRTLRIWDYSRDLTKHATGTSIGIGQETNQPVLGHTRSITCIAFSRNNKVIASASTDGLICLWDGDLGELQGRIPGHDREIRSLEFSYDSQLLLSSSEDYTVKIWDVETKKQLQSLTGHTDWVRAAVFSRDVKFIASGSDDRTVRVWDVQHLTDDSASITIDQMQSKHILRGHDDYVTSVVFSDDGKYVAAGGDNGRVLFWDLSSQHNMPPIKVLMQREGSQIHSLVFNSDASLLIASSSQKIWTWVIESSLRTTAQTDVQLHTLQLDPSYPEYLVTGAGPILMRSLKEDSHAQITSTDWCPYSFTNLDSYSDEAWITWRGKNIIFLPKVYRGGIAQVRDHTVAIGCYSGRFLFFRFKKDAAFSNSSKTI